MTWAAARDRSDLFEFDQGSGTILGIQEKDRFAMRPGFWAPIAKDAGACPLQLLARGKNVGDLEAEMMNRTTRMFIQKFRDRRLRAERFDQFDLGVRELDENHAHAMLRQGHGRAHLGAQRIAIEGACG